MVDWRKRITIKSDVMAGKPVVKGTRLTVEFIVGLLAEGWDEAGILEEYPGLSREDIHACLAYAREALSLERVYPARAS
jgi:uncharacterized protein (DUF433 family)